MIDVSRFESITATHRSNKVGSRYSFIPTTRVIDVLNAEGWEPSQASEVRTHKEGRRGFQKHLVRFRQANQTSPKIEDLIPEIVLTNSHNGSSSFRLMAGIFRLVCSNGLVVADSMFATHKIRHSGYTDDKVLTVMKDVIESTPRVMSRVDDFKNIHLTDSERQVYAEAALITKLGGEEKMPEGRDKDHSLKYLLNPRRKADFEPTLWNTYNTIQEKFLNGSHFLIKPTKKGGRRIAKSRAVKSVDKNVALNKALWTLTEKMAELKTSNNI